MRKKKTKRIIPLRKLKLVSLKNQKAFDQVNLAGKKFVCRYFVLILEKNSTEDPVVNIGLKVGRKMGNAIVRNKIRRRLKHMLRDFINSREDAWGGSKFLFIPKRLITDAKYSDITLGLERALA